MTIGHPDGQAYSQWQGPNLAAGFSQNLAAGTTVLWSGAVVNFSSLHIRIAPQVGYGKVNVSWYLDQALTQQTGGEQFIVPQGYNLAVFLPIRGTYAAVSFVNTSGAAATVQTTILGTNTPVTGREYALGNAFIFQSGTVLAAGGTHLRASQNIFRGPGNIQFFPSDATGSLHLTIDQIDESTAIVNQVVDLLTPTAERDLSFNVPDVPTQVRVVNNDLVSSHTFGYIYVAIPARS